MKNRQDMVVKVEHDSSSDVDDDPELEQMFDWRTKKVMK